MSAHHQIAASTRQHPALVRLYRLDDAIVQTMAAMDEVPSHSPILAHLQRRVEAFRVEREDTVAELRSDFTRTFGDVDLFDFAGRVGC